MLKHTEVISVAESAKGDIWPSIRAVLLAVPMSLVCAVTAFLVVVDSFRPGIVCSFEEEWEREG